MARPELMAIGDSIYNGVRSLTIDAGMARLSVPAQVARAFQWDFVAPDYPRNVLFDFERLMRQPDLFLQLRQIIIGNVHDWLADPDWSQHDAFDNLAIAQAQIKDLTAFTYRDHVGEITRLLKVVTDSANFQLAPLMDLHMAVNGCFLLNPANDGGAAVAGLTPLEIVALRKPKRLLVNIGINDGIWTVCLEATLDQLNTADILSQITGKLGTELLKLRTTGAVDNIYFNLLPKPSVVANLTPPRNPPACPPANGYYPRYIGRLGQIGGLDSQGIHDADTKIAQLNQDIRAGLGAMFAPVGGLAFVDIFSAMALQDDKHCRETTPIRVNHGSVQWHLTNKPLQSVAMLGGFVQGGMFGLDNLHPTGPGYAILARAVCDAISKNEMIPIPRPIVMQDVFDADTLLQNLPGALDFEDFLLDVAVSFVS